MGDIALQYDSPPDVDDMTAPSSPVTPPRVVGPCHDEDAHADACSCSSDPFSC